MHSLDWRRQSGLNTTFLVVETNPCEADSGGRISGRKIGNMTRWPDRDKTRHCRRCMGMVDLHFVREPSCLYDFILPEMYGNGRSALCSGA